MSVVSFIVDEAQGFLDDAAETQFGAIAATVGTVTTVAVTLVLILVCINMVFQYRSMDGRAAFWLGVKIVLIGIFAQNWTQFNALSTAILSGIDSIAGSLITAVGGGAPGPSGTYAEEFDRMIARFGDYLNAAGEELNWMAGAILSNLGVFLLSLLGALAAFLMVASRLMIALLLGLAPIMIFLTLFDVTKDYFARWLTAVVSFAMYPIIIAGVFSTITGVSASLLGELGDPTAAPNIGALVPFFMMVLMAKGFILATPFIVRAVSGNIMMPAISGGLGGTYAFGRAAFGSAQARNRYLMGNASGAEYAALRARSMVGIDPMPVRNSYGQSAQQQPANTPGPSNPNAGTAPDYQAQMDRNRRIGR
ncbi:Conjugal transfer protein [Sulfitobacter noctilucae]|uniref:type IV secretion system protein n=1 Tax=Sulfitobacter noctilucae TaxID=1342302 RepID=UPI00046810F2|nr:type IV secretion system protein [Sulfitobacter noctilucae]KIN69908.1 Conjugal transfer protein [Sulfitobacter noctilucae]